MVADKTKEYSAKSWGFLKSAYANVASSIEQTAAANGYKVDLGERLACVACCDCSCALLGCVCWTLTLHCASAS